MEQPPEYAAADTLSNFGQPRAPPPGFVQAPVRKSNVGISALRPEATVSSEEEDYELPPSLVGAAIKTAALPAWPASRMQEAERTALTNLADYLEGVGGSADLVSDWSVSIVSRAGPLTAEKQCDPYYFAPSGERFRSRPEVARHFNLGISKQPPPPGRRSQTTGGGGGARSSSSSSTAGGGYVGARACVPVSLRGKKLARREQYEETGRPAIKSQPASGKRKAAAEAPPRWIEEVEEWIGCDRCDKWRKVPASKMPKDTEAEWYAAKSAPSACCSHTGTQCSLSQRLLRRTSTATAHRRPPYVFEPRHPQA